MYYKEASVLIVYKNFAVNSNVSHIGLGVAALNNQKVLRALGLHVDVEPIKDVEELAILLINKPRTHVIISAPWIETHALSVLCRTYSDTHFFLNCHSNVGFLQADPRGVLLFRQGIELEEGTHNFKVSGNSAKFSHWVRAAFCAPCAVLPNLYFLDGHTQLHQSGDQGVLKIGSFGATRPLKNLPSAAGAALEIARDLRRPLEFWSSSGRTEGGGATVVNATRELLANLPGVEFRLAGWRPWPGFKDVVAQMHLLLQPSYTESFNIVTADGIDKGVPSVASEAIDWVPDYWHANSDDVNDIARVGKLLLSHRNAAEDGLNALVKHNKEGVHHWKHSLHLSDLPGYEVPHKLAA